MTILIGPCHSNGAHDFRAPLAWRAPMKVFFRGGGVSLDSWTPGPKSLCHRHPTGPHPSGLAWTPVDSRQGSFDEKKVRSRRRSKNFCSLRHDKMSWSHLVEAGLDAIAAPVDKLN